MSINPPSDILLDVVRAADPVKAQAAAAKLSRLASGQSATPDFAATFGGLRPSSTDSSLLRARMAATSARPATAARHVDAKAKAYQGLEALVLQNLVETMIPKDSDSFFGKSMGGEMWRSMLAQQLATQLSKSVDLGMFKKAAGLHSAAPATGPTPATGLPLAKGPRPA